MAPTRQRKKLKSSSQPTTSSSAPAPSESPLARIATLEASLTEPSPRSLNPLADLLLLLTTSPEPEVVFKAVYACGRVLASLHEQGRLDAGKDDKEKVVVSWLRARREEFVSFCGGLLKDEEKDLRTAALSHLINFLPILSTPSSKSITPQQPAYSSPHLRSVLRFILFPTPSTRGGSLEFSIPLSDEAQEEELEEGVERGLEVEDDVVEEFGNVMEEKRDFRWAVFREISALIRPYLPPTSQLAPSSLSSNLLSLLNTQTAFPTTQKALEKQAVLIPSFKTSPFSGTSSKAKSPINAEASADWRDYFESDEEEEADDVGGKNAVGSKKGKKAGGEARRQSSMTVHQGVWALESHRTVFTNAWMGLLSLPLDPAIARHVLVILHHQVLPNMAKARVARTADWLGEWVDRGGPLGLLALNGLFILIRDYNLDYPDFYDRLYAMFDRALLHVKYRARFFRLTETFLASSHLPATLIASFIKRLARLSLSAPPSAIIMTIPFIYNLLKLHPSCMVLIHRDNFGGIEPSLDPAAQSDGNKDPYDASHPNPLQSNALDSSLWEIATHQKHYLSSVSSLAKIFTEVFTKPRYGMEDFLDHTYVTLFETESKRKLRNDPALALPVTGDAFPAAAAKKLVGKKKRKAEDEDEDEDEVDVVSRDVVSELFTF